MTLSLEQAPGAFESVDGKPLPVGRTVGFDFLLKATGEEDVLKLRSLIRESVQSGSPISVDGKKVKLSSDSGGSELDSERSKDLGTPPENLFLSIFVVALKTENDANES